MSTGLPTSRAKKDKLASRITVACERCRKRHIRCNGGDKCQNCIRANSVCVYVEGEKKIVVSLKYIQSLQEEILRLRGLEPTNSLEIKEEPNGLTFGLPGDGSDTSSPRSVKRVKPDDSSSDSSSNLQSYQGSSSLSLFGLEIQNMLAHSHDGVIDFNEGSAAILSSYTNDPRDCLFSKQMFEDGVRIRFADKYLQCGKHMVYDFTLPTYDYALECFNEFYIYLGEVFYFFNNAQFKSRLNITYDPSENSILHSCLWYAQLLLVLAIGEMYLDKRSQKRDFSKFPGIIYYEKAFELINIAFNGLQVYSCNLDTVEVLLLYGFYHQIMQSPLESFILSGVCLRTALILRMHDDNSGEPTNEKITCARSINDIEHRRRLWWTIYYADRYFSAKLGFPISIPDESISTPLPMGVHSYDTSKYKVDDNSELGEFQDVKYINCFVKLSLINSSILVGLYQPPLEKNILPIISHIMNRLLTWKKDLANDRDLGTKFDENGVELLVNNSRTAVNIYSEYFQCINLTIRPLLFHFVRKRILLYRQQQQQQDNNNNNSNNNIYNSQDTNIDLSSYSEAMLSLLNASLEGSISTIRILDILIDRGLFATFGYLDREYTFLATSTLIMFNIAFGVSRRTSTYIQTGLRVLEIQEQSGNTYASARRTQLNNLISSFDFIDGVRLDGSNESLADTNVPLQGNPNHHHSILQRFVERTGSTGDYAEVIPSSSSSAAGNRRIPQLYGQAWPETPEAAAAAHAQMQQQQQEQHSYNMRFGSSRPVLSHHNNNDTNNNDSHGHHHNHNHNNGNGIGNGLPAPAAEDSFYGLNNIDRELWNEISFQPPLWLGNVSDEFKNLITEL